MAIFSLPTEIVLSILRNLPLRDLISLRRTSHYFNTLVKNNDILLYHEEAIRHNFADEAMLLADVVKGYPGVWLNGLTGWRDLCTLLERWLSDEALTDQKAKGLLYLNAIGKAAGTYLAKRYLGALDTTYIASSLMKSTGSS